MGRFLDTMDYFPGNSRLNGKLLGNCYPAFFYYKQRQKLCAVFC